jgi:ribosomal protein L11 methyltransferase
MRAFRLEIAAHDEDGATAALYGLGTAGIEVKTGEGGLVLLAYFADRLGLDAAVTEAVRPFGGAISPAEIEDVDWVARFREGFRAFEAPPFRIVPAWERPPRPAKGVILVEPGRAFGTGTHETTRLCLSLLASVGPPLGSVLDLGTGTGIIGVAASRLGSPSVTAIDNDPDAIEQARLHARLNAVELRLVRGDLTAALAPRPAFHVILANLTAPLLRAALPEMWKRTLSGGTLILSGLLETDLPFLKPLLPGKAEVAREGEWAAMRLERP